MSPKGGNGAGCNKIYKTRRLALKFPVEEFAVMEFPLVEFISVEFPLVVPDKFGRF